jgi:hypothetical protein
MSDSEPNAILLEQLVGRAACHKFLVLLVL